MSNNSEKLGISDSVKKIKLGKSFGRSSDTHFHTVRYDFKPASVDAKKMATLDVGEKHEVTVTLPHVNKGSVMSNTVFKGSKKPYQKECVLIIDHRTGEITLEKLDYCMQLKKTRNGGGKAKQAEQEKNSLGNGKKSPSLQQKLSPQPKWSSPVPKCSPLPKSPTSPPGQVSPPVPSSTVPAATLQRPDPSKVIEPSSEIASLEVIPSQPSTALQDDPDVAYMSTSGESSAESSSSGSGGSSSESDSSDEESEVTKSSKPSLPQKVNTNNSQGESNAAMPRYTTLSQDLQLSDDSDA